jgi:tetratricopeptide (TPR) repeat protein
MSQANDAALAIDRLLQEAQESFVAGRLVDAAAAYEKVLSTGSELLPLRTRASVANNLGLVAVRQKSFERALVFFEQSLALLTAAEDAARRAQIMGNIGSVYRDQEEGEPALRWYRQALALFESLGDANGAADQHTNIAYILALKGDPAPALTHYRAALAWYADNNERKASTVRANIDALQTAT